MNKTIQKAATRTRRHTRIRARVAGTPGRPRLSVHKSNRAVQGQLIDDTTGTTLAHITSLSLPEAAGKPLTEAATLVGRALAKAGATKGVGKVVFDRGGFIYTGVVRALADGAREGGLEF